MPTQAGRKPTDPDGSPKSGAQEDRAPGGASGSGAAFDQRLSQARNRHGLDHRDDASDSVSDTSALGLVLRVGVELVAASLVGLAIGWGLDFWLHTRPLFIVVFVLLGGAAGIVNVWRLVGRPPS